MQEEEKLKMIFGPDDLEWRVQPGKNGSGIYNGKPWARVLCYVTARAVMDRLDDVFGIAGWRAAYREGPSGGIICQLSCFIDGDWVTKEDGAENTKIESVKGGLSSAFKRAAVHWGIGRYLYALGESFAKFDARGKYRTEIEKSWYKWNPPS